MSDAKTDTATYVCYKGDEVTCVGTIRECCEALGVTPDSIQFMASPSGMRRFLGSKTGNASVAVRVPEAVCARRRSTERGCGSTPRSQPGGGAATPCAG